MLAHKNHSSQRSIGLRSSCGNSRTGQQQDRTDRDRLIRQHRDRKRWDSRLLTGYISLVSGVQIQKEEVARMVELHISNHSLKTVDVATRVGRELNIG